MGGEVRLGAEIAGYRIESLLGRGGMSVVYLADDPSAGRKVALKLLSPELANNYRFRERFLKESKLAETFDHPNIVPIYDAGEADDQMFIAMRYIDGTDLKTLLKVEGPLDGERTVTVIDGVAGALDAAHIRGLVHRDVKPSNVLVARGSGDDGGLRVYLGDFGITKQVLSESATLTATGELVGTMEYVAPEQIKGEPVDARTDVYSLGCLLYECLTAKVPYPRDMEAAMLWAHMQDPPPRVSTERRDLPASLDDVIARAMAKPPDERYSTAGALAMDLRLELGMAGAVVPAEFIRERRRAKRRAAWRRIRPRLAWGTAALAVAAGAAVGILALVRGPGPPVFPRGPNTVAEIDASSNTVIDGVRVGVSPQALAVGKADVWVANHDDQTVTRVDRETGKVLGNPSSGGTPTGIAAGEGSVWIANSFADTVSVLDPRLGRVNGRVSDVASPDDVTVGFGYVWVTSNSNNVVYRVEPQAKQRTPGAPIRVGEAPKSIAAGEDGVWVGNTLDGVTRIDPHNGKVVVKSIDLQGAKADGQIAVGAGAVWVTSSSNRVFRIDPKTNEVTMTKRVGTGPGGIAVTDNAVWVACATDGRVWRLDAKTGDVVRRIPVGGSPEGVAIVGDRVWVTVAPKG
jgi:streptogramin lyase